MCLSVSPSIAYFLDILHSFFIKNFRILIMYICRGNLQFIAQTLITAQCTVGANSVRPHCRLKLFRQDNCLLQPYSYLPVSRYIPAYLYPRQLKHFLRSLNSVSVGVFVLPVNDFLYAALNDSLCTFVAWKK